VSAYDDEIWRLVPSEPGPPPAPLLRFVRSLPEVGKALDVGCGDGRLSRELPAERITGVDVSPLALERAWQRLPDAELVLVRPDERLPFPDSTFELALCAETVEHVRDVQLLLSELRRVLAPGGVLALTTPAHGPVLRTSDPLSPHIRFFTRRSLRRLLGELGFEVVSLARRSGTLLVRATR
jgi:ubiquinone/menaquinone biosynthesis C-methylase UbiE